MVTAQLLGPPRRDPSGRYDGVGAGSACGVCGTQSIDDVLRTNHPVAAGPVRKDPIPHHVVLGLPGRLRDQQRLFERTGGLHAAGLFQADGTPLVVREDVGRHNAVDKVVGAQLLGSAPAEAPLLCVSGRIGFELVQKAVAARVAVIVAVGAPSSLAVELAERAGLCVVGFVRDARCVVYTVPDRIGV